MKLRAYLLLAALLCYVPAEVAAISPVPDFSGAAISTSMIMWNWSTGTYTSSTADGYRLYSSSTSNFVNLSVDTSYYIDSGLGTNNEYTRWILAYKGGQSSDPSYLVSKYTYANPPATFSLDVAVSTGVEISWHYSDATAYAVEISSNGAPYYYNRACFTPPQALPLASNTTYSIRLGAINGDGIQTPGLYSVAADTVTPPYDPDFTGAAVSSCSIRWSWSSSIFAGTGITAYVIYCSTIASGGAMPAGDDYGVVLKTITDPNTSSWVEGPLEGDNKLYARWIKAEGTMESLGKKVVQRYTYAVAPATCAIKYIDIDNIGENFINLEWNPGNASNYVVEYSTTADLSTSKVALPPSSSGAVNGLTSDTKYDLRVGAVNGDGVQTPDDAFNPRAYTSNTIKVVTRPPVVPNVYAAPVSYTAIKWSWSTGTYTNLPYLIGYSIGELQYIPLYKKEYVVEVASVLDTSATSYVLDYLVTNSTQTRYVSAKQFAPGYTTYGSITNPYQACTYATPPNDVYTSSVTSSRVGLYWKEPIVPPTQYRVERSANISEDGPWVFVSSVTGTNYFTDTGLANSTTYCYRIGAVNLLGIQTLGMKAVYGPGVRDYSFLTSTITLQGPPVLYGVAASTDTIVWNWTTDVPGISYFNIYTSTNGVLNGNIGAATRSWVETNIAASNSRVTRRIVCATGRGVSDYAEASCYTLADPPSGIAVSTSSQHSIAISWNSNGCSKFRVDRSLDNSQWTTVKGNTANLTAAAYTDTGLKLSTKYYYAVFGYNGDGIITVSSATLSQPGRTGDLPSETRVIYSSSSVTQYQSATVAGLGDIIIEIPAGAMARDGYIYVNVDAAAKPIDVTKTDLDAITAKLKPSRLVDNSVVELFYYDLYGSIYTGSFNAPVKLSFSYPDSNGDDLVDNMVPTTNVASLKIYTLNTSDKLWEPVSNSKIDIALKQVHSYINHFSIYSLVSGGPVKDKLSQVIVYPNPYKPGTGGQFDSSLFGKGIVFENLTAKANIRIFNIAGELVRNIQATDGSGRYVWDASNDDGSKVASGLYVYIITDIDNTSVRCSGKFCIIK